MIRFVVHMVLHIIAPGIVARVAYRDRWKRAWGVMMATMLVDLDHLLATPILDAARCSIGVHPLHTAPALAVYVVLTVFRRTRLVGLGLVIHMVLDALDCVWMRFG